MNKFNSKLKTNLSQYTRQAQEKKVVYGSELHEVLGVKSNYREWIKRRVSDIDAEEDVDFYHRRKFRQCQAALQRKTISSNLTPPKKWQCLSGTKKESKYADISFV